MTDYKQILSNIGWPTDILVLDWETYFDKEYSLSKMSTIEYICSPKFDFTGVGYYLDEEIDFVPKPLIKSFIETQKDTFGKNLENCTIIAQNAKFDITVLVEKFGINPPYVIDTKDLASYYDARMSHHLKDLAKMFGLEPKGETLNFIGLHYEDMSPEMQAALARYGVTDIEITTDLFKILLPKLTTPEIELPIARHILDLYLIPRFKFDFKKAELLKIRMKLVLSRIVRATGCTEKELSGTINFAKLLMELLPGAIPLKPGKPTKNMIKLTGKQGMIPAVAKDDVPFQLLLADPDEKISNLCKARQAIKSWPLHLKRIDKMSNQARASGGILRVPVNYYGAHTGRTSGGEKINLLNLGGRGRAGSGNHPLISEMRGLLCAIDGHTLGIADSAQIEARILAWLAGQNDLLKEFAEGKSPYCTLATKLFGEKVWKPSDEEKKTPEGKAMAIKYGFGKDGILGAGYGMGVDRFYNNCLVNKNLRPFFDSGKYNRAFIERLIKTYRNTYSKIPEFWSNVEQTFKYAIKYRHAWAGKLGFHKEGTTVHIVLPSGRHLLYRHSHIDKENNIKWHYGHLWGGSIVENIVQSISRDLLVYWILKMKKQGLNPVFDCYDETICMLLKDNAESELQKMMDIMCTGPEWATGLPLGVEGELSEVYKK